MKTKTTENSADETIRLGEKAVNLLSVLDLKYEFEGYEHDNLLDAIRQLKTKAEENQKPVDLLLYCPSCAKQHIDRAQPNICETCGGTRLNCICEFFTEWLNPPHKSHRCHFCNHVWRPADVATNGVASINSKGERDSERKIENPVEVELAELKSKLETAFGKNYEELSFEACWKNVTRLMGENTSLGWEIQRLNQLINTPHTADFIEALPLEAAHQVERWGHAHDEGKEPTDWLWVIGYLAGKATNAAIDGNLEKAKHHTISTAAVCLNWYRRIVVMRKHFVRE